MKIMVSSKLDAVGTDGCKASVETYSRPMLIPDARTPEWKELAGNLPATRKDALNTAQVIPGSAHTMQIVPNSERYYCRVNECDSFTWANVPYGYCDKHLLQHFLGEVLAEKPFPPVGKDIKQHYNA